VNPASFGPASDAVAAGRAGQPLLGWWADQAGAISGAFPPAPPHPLLLTAVPARVEFHLPADRLPRR
jgi:hypothetical protein